MIASTDTDLIIPALVECLGKMEDITKTRTAKIPTKAGGEYKYTYADLRDVLGYLRPLLAEHGLAVSQMAHTDDKGSAVTTTLLHTSGQWIEGLPLRLPAGVDAQSHGSSITFGRRYALLAFFGLATEDDDGQAASQAPKAPRAATGRPKGNAGPTDAQTKRAMAMFKAAGIEEREARLEFTSFVCKRQVTSWSDVSSGDADLVMGVLDNLIAGKVALGFEDDGTMAVKAVA